MIRKAWLPPESRRSPGAELTFATYADTWMDQRDLKDRTREHYRELLDEHILPDVRRAAADVDHRRRRRELARQMGTGTPTLRAHCLRAAADDHGHRRHRREDRRQPVRDPRRRLAKRVHMIRPASLDELRSHHRRDARAVSGDGAVGVVVRAAVRRTDRAAPRATSTLEADDGLSASRAVVRAGGGFHVTTPKCDAGIRDVAIPPHLLPAIETIWRNTLALNRDSLLFPAEHGGHLAPATLYRQFYRARDAAGRPDLRFHDLRHSGAVLAARDRCHAGRTDGPARALDTAAALRYQHAAAGRDREIAALSTRAWRPTDG